LADFFIIAPATADLIARLAMGRADDLLTNLVLASNVPKMLVPAMHPAMWSNPATVENVKTLRSRGFLVVEPEVGRLTGSDVGKGRFPDTQTIISKFLDFSTRREDLKDKTIVVTAGGTREAIDPVRYIGNKSSGKQGVAVARAAQARGANVTLIAANIPAAQTQGLNVINVESADEVSQALDSRFDECDILVMAAAIADARPATRNGQKIKKKFFTTIELVNNPDLLAGLAAKKKGQVLIGFAAETSDLFASAHAKLVAKDLDLIYVNDVSEGAIFGADETEGTIILKNGTQVEVTKKSKDTLANLLLDYALEQLG
jgi:phosphopantothenoylcysteine decarboxylase/phosphopantothenate--cysteine ligase